MKQKLLNSIRLRLLMLLAVLVSGINAAWGDTKTEGFETKAAGTNYQSTVTISESESDCGIGWEIYYGCVSTNNKITGSNSAALRLYTTNNYGYIKTTTPIEGLSNVAFKIKAAESNSASIKVNVQYSTDGSSWTNLRTNYKYSTSTYSENVDIPSGGKYFRIIITDKSTKPSKSNAQLTIDDVVFTYTPPVTSHTLTYSATNGSIAGVDAGSNAVASGAKVAEDATVTLTATPADGYTFSSWSVEGTGSTLSKTDTNPTTFTMGTANATVTANFVKAGDYISASPTTTNIATAGDVAEFTLSTNLADPSYSVAYYTTSAGDETTTKPSWLGEVEISGSTLDIEVNANTGAPRTAYLKVYSGTTYSSVITINQAGKSYAISVDDDVTGGSIEADLSEAVVGATVSLTATPDAAYTFGSWTVYKNDMSTKVTVTDNKFTMPDCEVYVTATFNAKPTYAITCAASPVAGGTLEASPASAYEGQTVTLSYLAEDGYDFSSIVITKTSDGTATGITPAKSGDDYTFTMPGYAVTATATFEYNLFEGSFAKVTSTSALEDGGYYILYSTKAMNSTVTSGKMGATAVTINNDIIENPNKSIVWTLVKNGDNWDLYNEKEEQYCYIEGTNTSAFKMAESASYHFAVTTYAEGGGFKFKTTHSSNRGINYGSDNFGSYADSNDPTVYLYKYTVLTPRTITFDGNGGTYNEASTYTQDVYDGVEASLNANQFTRSGYAFDSWNTEDDGSGDSYDDEDDITVSGGDLTLYAQWTPVYTLTIDDAIVGGSVAVDGDVASAVAGAEITLTNTPSSGYGFSAWDVYKAGDTSTKVTVTDDKFTMPSYNVVISATFEEVQTYTLLTNANQLVSGKHYIIASGTNGSVKAMGSQNTNNRVAVSVTASSGIIPETDGVYEFVIYGPDASGNYEIFDDTNSKYLYAASSSDNHLKMQTPNNANGKWSIAIGNTGIATIKAKGSNTRNTMQYNSGNTIFSCYGSASQSAVYLYEKDGEDTPTESVNVTAAGYATYVSDNALDFSESSINAYIAIADGTTGVTFSQITKVPANTGVLLYKEGGATESIPSLTGAASDVTGNVFLRGTGAAVASVVGDLHNYILNKPSEKPIGFYKAAGQTVAKNRAYIQIDESTPVKEFISLPWDDATAIESLTPNPSPMSEGSIFNLAGQKMSKLQKGVNIVNGKKVLVK